MTTTDDRPVLRISGPANLLQAVPYLLGFHPAASLVLIGLTERRLAVTARLDLDDVAEDGVLRHAVRGIANGGAETVVAAVYDERSVPGRDGPPWRGLAADLQRTGHDLGIALGDVLLVCGGRWWSLRCDDPVCCPPEGRPLPDAPSAFVAAATYAGMVALPDRRSLEALLAPAADREALRPLLTEAERAAADATTAGERRRWERLRRRELVAAARASDAGELDVDRQSVARFGAALRRIPVRDALWSAADTGRIDGRDLWRELARRLPPPYDAAPLFLYGWGSWRHGNGALANVACDRALESDPGYSAADLLLAALAHVVDPRRVPRMRVPSPR
jgi:hypothetical protein